LNWNNFTIDVWNSAFRVGKAGEDHKEAFQSLKQRKQRWESLKSSVWVLERFVYKKKQIPSEQKMMNELKKWVNNIAGNSGMVGLHARTGGSTKESKLWSG